MTHTPTNGGPAFPAGISSCCYQIADAMIAARDTPKGFK